MLSTNKREGRSYYIQESSLTILRKLEKVKQTDFRNDVYIVRKNPLPQSKKEPKQGSTQYENNWFLKKQSTKQTLREVVGQEFLRLILHEDQPKTRAVLSNDGNYLYTLSKEVLFTPLSEQKGSQFKYKFANGKYANLGKILFVARVTREKDLRLRHVGAKPNDRMVKIDGDQMFASLISPNRNFSFTEEDMALLPMPGKYQAYNWLDYINKDELKEKSDYLKKNTCNNAQFRHEVNYACLKTILLSTSIVERFVDHIIGPDYQEDKEDIFEELSSGIDEAYNASVKNKSFCEYLQSQQAKEDFAQIKQELLSFTMTGKTRLFASEEEEILNRNFNKLHEIVKEDIYQSQQKESDSSLEEEEEVASDYGSTVENNSPQNQDNDSASLQKLADRFSALF